MKKNILIKLFALFFLISFKSVACNCDFDKTESKITILDYMELDYIFIGKCIKIDKKIDKNIFTFIVEKKFKGVKNDSIIDISTKNSISACGFESKINDRWLISAHNTCDAIYTSFCSKNRIGKDVNSDSTNLELMLNFKNGNIEDLPFANLLKVKGVRKDGLNEGEWLFFGENNKIVKKIIFNAGLIKTWESFYLNDFTKMSEYVMRRKKVTFIDDKLTIIEGFGKEKKIYNSRIIKTETGFEILENNFDYFKNRYEKSFISIINDKCIRKSYFGKSKIPKIVNCGCQFGFNYDIIEKLVYH